MSAIRARVLRMRQEAGFTLIETMLTAATLSVILIAILSISDTTTKLVPKDQERAAVLREAQVGLHSMTRELRQATEVYATGPYLMDVEVPVRGTSTRVSYRCDVDHPTNPAWKRCVRFEGARQTSIPVDRVINGARPVFEFTTDPQNGQITYVNANVEVPAAGDRKDGHKHKVMLDDGFYMRNRDR